MRSFRQLASLLLLVLALGVGTGLARAGVVEVEGDIRFQILPVPTCLIKGGPVGGPYTSGPFTADEPVTYEFSAWGVTDPNGGTLTLEWDFSYDGSQFNTDATGPGPFLRTYTDGPVDSLIAVRLTSSTGAVGYVTQRVLVNNAAPTATLDGPYTGQPGQTISFVTTATDPSPVDTAAGLHYAWDFDYWPNVFTTEASGIGMNTASHTYSALGDYTVAVRITDKDGGSVVVTSPVSVAYVTTQLNLASVADAYIAEDFSSTNYGSSALMYVKADDSGHARRALAQFDLSSIPTNAIIVSATLNLYADSVPVTQRTSGVYRATSSWAESTVKWNLQPTVIGGATDASVTPASPGWVGWNVTTDVQAFVSGMSTNYGWVVKDINENSGSGVTIAYDTKENGTATARPVLVVIYATP